MGSDVKKLSKKMAKNFDIFWRTSKFLFFIFLKKNKKKSTCILPTYLYSSSPSHWKAALEHDPATRFIAHVLLTNGT